ncbi:hypothetical protein HDU99_010319, partial [Rhizoclosmatium hyalinum]
MEDVCGNVQPLLPELLGLPPSSHVTTANAEAEDDEIENVMGLVESVKKEFTLNQDQGSVIETIAMSVLKGQNGFQLVHGVWIWQNISTVAVDQILQTLLSLEFTDFVRIGSIKKISKAILPYTLQQLKSSNDDLKELRAMLKADGLDVGQKRSLQEAVRRFT